MKKYSNEYWLHHYEYAMGYKKKIEIDTSDANWTKKNITKVLNGENPFGMTSTNGAKAFVEFIKIYYPNKMQELVKFMLGYIKSVQTTEKPFKKVYNFYLSVINL